MTSASPTRAEATPTPTPERQYVLFLPIIIKENVALQPVTVVLQQGHDNYSGAVETFISSYGDPYAPHGYEPIIAVRWQRSDVADAEAGLSQWDLTSIPTSAAVQSATLRLYVTGRSNINSMTLTAYGVLRPWLAWESNWYSATVGTAWAVAGCNGINYDRRGLPTSSVNIANTGVWIELPVTPLVQDWVRHPHANFGLVLKPTGTSSTPSARYEMASSLYPELARRPILSITYVLPPSNSTVARRETVATPDTSLPATGMDVTGHKLEAGNVED